MYNNEQQRTRSIEISAKVIQISCVILLFIWFAESAAGSCLNYGHSCWGAHGKRNNEPPIVRFDDDTAERMLLSKLIQASLRAKSLRKDPTGNAGTHYALDSITEDLNEPSQGELDKLKKGPLSEDHYAQSVKRLFKLLDE